MSWSYSGDPKTSPKDTIRFYVGDKNEKDPLLQDEEIQFMLDTKSQYQLEEIAAQCCEAIAADFSRLADKAIDDLKVTYSQKAAQYIKMAAALRKRGNDESDFISTGTTTKPAFRRGMNTLSGY